MTMTETSAAPAASTTTDTMVLVGTSKGLFTLRSGDGRNRLRGERSDVPGRGGLRHVHRRAVGLDAVVHGFGQQPLGSGVAPLGRSRGDVDRGRTGGLALS